MMIRFQREYPGLFPIPQRIAAELQEVYSLIIPTIKHKKCHAGLDPASSLILNSRLRENDNLDAHAQIFRGHNHATQFKITDGFVVTIRRKPELAFKAVGGKSADAAGAVKRLQELGGIEMTLPEKPNSRLQKYRLTRKGRDPIAKLAKEGK